MKLHLPIRWAILLCLLFAVAAKAQTVNTEYAKQINATFANLDKTKIPHQLLLDYAMEFAELSIHDGTLTNENYLHRGSYTEIYNTLLMARVTPNVTGLIAPNRFNDNWNSLRQPNKIVLSGLYYKYSRFKDNAVPNYLTLKDSLVYDKYTNGAWQNPYEEKQVFAMASPILVYNYLTLKVEIPPLLWYTNQAGSVQNIAVDFGDGSGYHSMPQGQEKTVTYSNEGVYEWKYRLTLTNGQVLESHGKIQIRGTQATMSTNRTINEPCTDGNGIDDVEFDGVRAFQGKANSAVLEIDYAADDCIIRRPLIVAEGFDSGLLGVENPLGESDYQGFLNEAFFNTGNLPTQLNTYDIIYVNWVKGKDDLHRNAYLLEDIIKWVNTVKQGNTPNVVLGQSMGGVIARYALRDMELQQAQTGSADWNHDTRLYISHDAPQQGANIPLSILFFARHMADQFVGTPAGDININPGGGGSVTIEDLQNLLDATGTQQLLINTIGADLNRHNNVSTAWQNELHTMGYPTLTRNIAISNGNHCAETQTIAAYDTLLSLNGSGKTSLLTELIISLLGLNGVEGLTLAFLFDEPALLLTAIPGNSKFGLDFNAKALPLQGQVKQIYKGKITFTKKVLGLFNLPTINLTNETYNNPIIFPYDYYPGGVYPVPFTSASESESNIFFSYGISMEAAEGFDFIPIPSALDIGGGTTILNDNDYLTKYNSENPPLAPKASPFDNFTTSYTVGSNLNEEHISFNTRNGNWLATELDNNDTNNQIFDCTYICDDDQMIGPGHPCEVATFSLVDKFNTYSWSLSPFNAGTLTGANNSFVSVDFGNYEGLATIQVSVESDCGPKTFFKEIYVGTTTPTINGIFCPTLSAPCNITIQPSNNYFIFNLTAPTYSYTPGTQEWQWEKISGNFYFLDNNTGLYNGTTASTQTANLYITGANPINNPMTFKVRMKNDCGWGQWRTYTWNDGSTDDPEEPQQPTTYFQVSPNPANGNYVNMQMINYLYNIPSGTLFQVSLYSIPPIQAPWATTNIYYNGVGQTTSGSLNITNVPPGTYALIINLPNGQNESHTIYIQ